MTGTLDEKEIADELGRLFIDSVERRCRKNERVGIELSGGLDSRVILAAMPKGDHPINAVTFGIKESDDAQIARKVAKVKGIDHHFFEINQSNWLAPRLDGIWWTDGQMDVLHMHGIECLSQEKRLFDVCLNGFLGDALLGGSYFNDSKWTTTEKFQNRGRRFINLGIKLGLIFMETRIPFFSNRLMELTIAIPEKLRTDSHIYKKMLLRKFPKYFKNIPWQNTGHPIGRSKFSQKLFNFSRRVRNKVLRELGGKRSNSREYTDYPNWIRHEPAREIFAGVLKNTNALYPAYISRQQVLNDLDQHLNGKDRAEKLCRYLTFEIWLQQVFNGKFIPNHDHDI